MELFIVFNLLGNQFHEIKQGIILCIFFNCDYYFFYQTNSLANSFLKFNRISMEKILDNRFATSAEINFFDGSFIFVGRSDLEKRSFFGLTTKKFQPKPYLIILALLIPVVAIASTQHDFLLAYPKVKNIFFVNNYTHLQWLWKLIFEISYSLDFVSIELFFRGFLVIGFIRFVGADAILPMAAFYCTIHFGKPLGECISSFFGGMVLGVIAYRTKSIFGGLIVHLGIAWAMEVFGYLSPIVLNL